MQTARTAGRFFCLRIAPRPGKPDARRWRFLRRFLRFGRGPAAMGSPAGKNTAGAGLQPLRARQAEERARRARRRSRPRLPGCDAPVPQQGFPALQPFRIHKEITPAASLAMALRAMEPASRPTLVLSSGSAPASSRSWVCLAFWV